jgi:predicted transglutaminase-like cysteine proteinase
MSRTVCAQGDANRSMAKLAVIRRSAPLVLAALLSSALVMCVTNAVAKERKSHSAEQQTGFATLIRIAPPQLSDPAKSPASPAPLRFFTINKVLAKLDGSAPPTSVRLAKDDDGKTASDATAQVPRIEGTEPFGLFAFRAPEGAVSAKWRGVMADMAKEADVMTQCRASPDRCAPGAARFLAVIDDARRLDGRERLDAVNRAVNEAIHYTTDMVQFGVVDVWSAPLATFTTGRGDCEDYAIAKYVALREAGVAAEDLRILLVRDTAIRDDHAVLATRQAGHWLILDNRNMRLIDDSDIKHFMPLFAIDQSGVKLVAAPYVERMIDREEIAPATSDLHAPAEAYALPPLM